MRELNLNDVQRQLERPTHILVTGSNQAAARALAEKLLGDAAQESLSAAGAELEAPLAAKEQLDLVILVVEAHESPSEILGRRRMDRPGLAPTIVVLPAGAPTEADQAPLSQHELR